MGLRAIPPVGRARRLRQRGYSLSPLSLYRTLRFRRRLAAPRGRVFVNGSFVSTIEPGAHLEVRPGALVVVGAGGTDGVLHFDRRRGALYLAGRLVLDGGAKVGWATKIRVGSEGSLTVGAGTDINADCLIICRDEITIGAGCAIARRTTITDTDNHPHAADEASLTAEVPSAPVHIGDRVWIGAEVMILSGVTIGDGAVVAARSVVTKDVPAGSLVAGHPARVVRESVVWRT
jgi:acetyltransferase-like isoleucine patch superfamily enzyme